jgi:uncharacterized protein YutE (UPF0331/DUF86 family)
VRWKELTGCSPGGTLMASEPSGRQRDRWRGEITEHLEDFPRQYAALENAMAEFGEGFDPREFKAAFESTTDMSAYNHAQAVERALGRVQNYVAQLSITGAKLASLRLAKSDQSEAARAFGTLRDAGVISGALCRNLRRAQKARTMIEHSYVKVPAGTVHQAAELILSSARDFIGSYRDWVEQYL